MRPVVVTQTGAGQSVAIPLDRYIANFRVSIYALVTGTVAYAIQYTYDNVLDPAITATWIDSADAPAGQTASKEVFLDFPVAAVRINQASGAGSVKATVNQSGIV